MCRLGCKHDHVLAPGEDVFRFIEHVRCDHDVGHDLHDLLRRRAVERPVHRHDASERGHLVAFVGHSIGGGRVARDRQPAWVHVLDDRGRRLGVVRHERESGGGVLDVVEPRRTTLDLFRAADPSWVWAKPVEGRLLVLVLSVFEGLGEQPRDRDLGGKTVALVAPHISRDPGVVGRRMRVGLRGEALSRALVEGAFIERPEDLRIALGPHDDDHGLVILGRRPDHRRPADVDLLDGLFRSDSWPQHGLDERVQVAADEIDLPEPMLRQRIEVLLLVASGQDARVHPRMQRLDAAIHHLREARQLAHSLDVQGRVLDRLQSAAGGEQVITEPLQPTREGGEPGLVANGQKGCWQCASP